MGVDRVIGERPGDAAEIEKEGWPGEAVMNGAPADECSPIEGQPQENLRPVGEALHERIDGDDGQRCRADREGRYIELKQDEETQQALQAEKGEGRFDAHLA